MYEKSSVFCTVSQLRDVDSIVQKGCTQENQQERENIFSFASEIFSSPYGSCGLESLKGVHVSISNKAYILLVDVTPELIIEEYRFNSVFKQILQ